MFTEEGGKKKKGKKGAAAAAAEVKEEKKAPKKNKMIAAIQEAQKKIQEEEERFRQEAEEEEKRLEALDQARLEQERLEQERKEKKKKKEKERKERLKAEGKLLTPKQRADRARAQAMLDALGVAIPPAGEKKVRPGTRIRPNKMKQQTQQQTGEINCYIGLHIHQFFITCDFEYFACTISRSFQYYYSNTQIKAGV